MLPRPEIEAVLFGQLPLEGHPHAEFFRAAALDSLDRLILPSMEREVRRDLTEAAERHAVEVFAKNLRSLLLQPPIPKQVVLAIDPGFKTGCKIAVLDRGGNLLEQGVIFPHPPQNRRSDAKLFLKDLVGKHKVGVVAIGNGTACRETEELVAEIIAEGTHFSQNGGAVAVAERRGTAHACPTESDAVTVYRAAGHSRPPDPGKRRIRMPGSDSHEPAAESGGDHSQPPADLNQSRRSNEDNAAFDSSWPHPLGDGSVTSDRDGTGRLARDGIPSRSEPHPSPPAEAPLEALPPVSGGAPDSSSPEAEIEAAPGSSSA